SASTQASPIAWPPPVTSATRPSSLNISRYMVHSPCLDLPPVGRSAQRPAVLVEAMDAMRVRRKVYLLAGPDVDFADGADGEVADAGGIDVEKGVAADMLGDR